jgi:Dual specificity phosphatase, catalytic domain
MKHLFVLFLMNVSHAWDWCRRLFGPVKPWQYERSMILANLWLGGFFETWPQTVTCCVNVAEENDYQVPLGRILLDIGRPDLPPAMTPNELQRTTDWIAGSLKCGDTVLVTCDLGSNRSALVMCAYIASSMGLSAERARAFVAAKRNKHVLHEWQMEALQAYVASLGPRNGKSTDF